MDSAEFVLVLMDRQTLQGVAQFLEKVRDFIAVRDTVAQVAPLERERGMLIDADFDVVQQALADLKVAERTDLLGSFEALKEEAERLVKSFRV